MRTASFGDDEFDFEVAHEDAQGSCCYGASAEKNNIHRFILTH